MSTATRREKKSIGRASRRVKRGLMGATSVIATAGLVATGLILGTSSATAVATGATAGMDFGTYDGPRMVQLSDGGNVFGLDEDGKVWGWGVNNYRQVTGNSTIATWAPTELTAVTDLLDSNERVIQLDAGYSSTYALTDQGRIVSWGADTSYALGRNTTATAPGFVLTSAGQQLTGIAKIDAGHSHVLALDTTGHVWGWGLNTWAQLGINNVTSQRYAVQVPNLSGVTEVTAGHYHSAAIAAGKVKVWGANAGYLGVGNNTQRTLVPTDVVTTSGMTGEIISIAAGINNWSHTFAVDSSGQAWSWGLNSYNTLGRAGAVGVPNPVLDASNNALTGITEVRAGYYFGLALAADGTAYGWGWNNHGQLGIGHTTNASRATKIKNFDLGGDMTDIESISAGWYNTGIISSVGNDDGIVSMAGQYNRSGLLTAAGTNDTKNSLVPNLVWKFEEEYKEFPQELVPRSGKTALGGVAQPLRASGDFNYGVEAFALSQATVHSDSPVGLQLSGTCVRNASTGIVSLSSGASNCVVKRSYAGSAMNKPLSTETWTLLPGRQVQEVPGFTADVGGLFAGLTADSGRVALPVLTEPVKYSTIKYTVDPLANAGVCAMSGYNGTPTTAQRYLQILGEGECIIRAEQAGHYAFVEAIDETVTFTIGVGKAPQALTLTSLDGIRYAASEPVFTLPPTTDAPASQLVSYTVAPGSTVCSIEGTSPNQKIKALSAGSCVLGVSAPGADATAGNNGFHPYADTKTVVIGKGIQTLSMAGVYDGLTAVTTQSATLPTVTNEGVALGNWDAARAPAETKVNVCSVVGGVVEAGVDAPDPGSTDYVLCQVTASNTGNANYEPFSYSEIVEISERKQQSLDLAVLNGKKFGDAPFALPTVTTVGGQPVSYTASGACTVAEVGGVTTVTITSGGPCNITASAAGTIVPDANNDIWRPYGTETVAPVATIGQYLSNMPALNGLKVGSTSGLLPTVTVQGLPVTNWASATPSTCGIVDGRVQILLDGDCTITASNTGSASYAPFAYELSFAAAINYDGLNAAISGKVTGTNADSKYTASSWATYQTALAAAVAHQEPNGVSQAEVDATTAALVAAAAALVDLSGLRAGYENRATDENSYTPNSWAAYELEVTQALAVLNDPDATQAEVDAAVTELTAAKGNLVHRADFSLLQQEVDTDAALIEEEYTGDSWAAYEVALAAANAVLGDLNATQAEVDAALAELKTQVAALVYIAGLEHAVEDTEATVYVASDYSAASWSAYEAALADAKAVLADPAATQAEVDAALAALTDAITNLAYVDQTLMGLAAAISGHAVGDEPVTLPELTDRGAVVTYTAGPADICEVVDGKLVINGFGDCVVDWTAPAIGNFAAAGDSATAPTGPGLQLVLDGVQLAAGERLSAGQKLTARGGGLYPGTEVRVVLSPTSTVLGTAVVAADGTAVVTFAIPVDLEPGAYELQASGVSGIDASVLTRNAAVSVSNLAYTGAEIAPFVGVGLLLLLAGAGILVIGRSRRQLADTID